MLILDKRQRRVTWAEMKLWFDLVPMPEDVNDALIKETTTIILDEDDKASADQDWQRYAKKYGQHCIKGWGCFVKDHAETPFQENGLNGDGIVDLDGQPIPFSDESIADLMMVRDVQNFIFERVQGLTKKIDEVTAEGKPVSSPMPSGSPKAAGTPSRSIKKQARRSKKKTNRRR